MYANGNARSESSASLRAFPATIEQWLERQQPLLNVAPDRPTDVSPNRTIYGAAPLYGKEQFLWWSVAAGLLALANVAAYRWFN